MIQKLPPAQRAEVESNIAAADPLKFAAGLRAAADLEASYGDPVRAAHDRALASLYGIRIEQINLAKGRKCSHRDGQIICPFFLPFAAFARILFHFALESRENGRQQLQNNLGRDVGINAHGQ